MVKRPRWKVRGILIVAAALAATLISAVPAQAANYPYDGQDPVATGCSNGAYSAETTELRVIEQGEWEHVAWVDLRYSPRCLTTWGRIRFDSATGSWAPAPRSVFVTRRQDGKYFSCNNPTWQSSMNATVCYTPMLNDNRMESIAAGNIYWQGSTWSSPLMYWF